MTLKQTDLYAVSMTVRARKLDPENIDELLVWMHDMIKASNRAYSHGELIRPEADDTIRELANRVDITPRYIVVDPFGRVSLPHADQFEMTHTAISFFEVRGYSTTTEPPVYLHHLTEELKKTFIDE